MKGIAVGTLTKLLTKLGETSKKQQTKWVRVGIENRFATRVGIDVIEISGERTPSNLEAYFTLSSWWTFLVWVGSYVALPITAIASIVTPAGQSTVSWPSRRIVITCGDSGSITTFDFDREHPDYILASVLLHQAYLLAEVENANDAVARMLAEISKTP
jgi:hypothetical protein